MDQFWGIVITLVVLGICWAIIQYYTNRPRSGYWAILDYAVYAVRAAREITGSTSNAELGAKAEELIRTKFPKAPDVDIEVAIGKALDELEKKPTAPALPADPVVDSPDILA